MLGDYLSAMFHAKGVNCFFTQKDFKHQRTDDIVEISGALQCTLDNNSQGSTFELMVSDDFKKVCGIHAWKNTQAGSPIMIDYLFKTTLQMEGYEPRYFFLEKSSFGNIETICNVINKTIAQGIEDDEGKEVFKFELKYPQVIIHGHQK